MFHIYVDPLHGDDALAYALNPGGLAAVTRPADVHPDNGDLTRPRPIGGVLTHAPYPFKTLGRNNGAVAYIRNVLAWTWGSYPQPTFPFKTLPLTIPNVGQVGTTKYVDEIIIHCMPGLYGPKVQGLPDIDPVSGLAFNDELFPIGLDDHVSIQGTSALDTVFDCRGQSNGGNGGAFLIGEFYGNGFTTHASSFIDAVTIRGARSEGPPSYHSSTPFNRSGAGIWIGIFPRIEVTISNCIITDNSVGIAIDSVPLDEGNGPRPRIVNNTIAWNWIGIWNGNLYSQLELGKRIGEMRGYANLCVLNNVVDSGSPYAPASGFLFPRPMVGMHQDDVFVTARGIPPPWLTEPVNVNFNAYEPGLANAFGASPSNWPTPAQRLVPPPTALPASIVDISNYTVVAPYPPGGTRGALYVNDLFRKSQILGLGTDPTPHDFRLAPNAVQSGSVPPPAFPLSANPLVNKGLAIDGFTLSITFANGTTLAREPGIRSPGPDPDYLEDYASCHAWDWDCEGFGNPRIQLRPGYTDLPVWSAIDLGADEMGELIIPGFVNGTRTLASLYAPNLPNKRIWFLERNTGGPFARPIYNAAIGGQPRTGLDPAKWPWYAHKQAAPDAEPGTNYTRGVVTMQYGPTFRWTIASLLPGTQGNKEPLYPRALECDISPHLYMDPHGLWGALFDALTGFPQHDIYTSNSWADNTIAFKTNGEFDNPLIFYNPDPGYPKHGFWPQPPNPYYWPTLPQLSANLLGIANPPNTWYDGSANYLLPSVPTGQFRPFAPCGGGPTYTVNMWGLGDASPGCPDEIPLVAGLEGHGIRFNCQLAGAASNLQTLLSIADEVQGESASARAARTIQATSLTRAPTAKEIGDALATAYRALHSKRRTK